MKSTLQSKLVDSMRQNDSHTFNGAVTHSTSLNNCIDLFFIAGASRRMSEEDISNLPVSTIAKDNCILFLWVTYPCLIQGLKTITDWGFTYKTCGFSWMKKNKKSDSLFWGLGYWTRANNEICLLATKGKPKRVSSSVHQIIYEPIESHSKKPNCVRDKIVELCGDLSRIELFARQKTEGWYVWGNDV